MYLMNIFELLSFLIMTDGSSYTVFWCRGNGSDDGFDSDECEFSDDDFGSDDRKKMFMDEETKSRFTNYSMSSSVIKRNDGLTLLDDRFEKVCDIFKIISNFQNDIQFLGRYRKSFRYFFLSQIIFHFIS